MKEETLKLQFEIEDVFGVRDGKLMLKDGEHRKKVVILGFAPSWKDAPFDDKDFDIWCLNEMYDAFNANGIGRASLWFEIHGTDSPSKQGERHQAFLQNAPLPIVMQKVDPKYPSSIAYPREAVKALVNENVLTNDVCGPYTNFSNSISWMIYMAILMKYEEIHIYGVDMAHESEYAFQRPSAEAAILFAAAKGVKVAVPKSSELIHFPKDYGFETDNSGRHYKKRRLEELNKKKQKMIAEMRGHQDAARNIELGIAQIDGALSEINHDLTNAIV